MSLRAAFRSEINANSSSALSRLSRRTSALSLSLSDVKAPPLSAWWNDEHTCAHMHLLLWKLGHIPHVLRSYRSLLGPACINKATLVKRFCCRAHWKKKLPSDCRLISNEHQGPFFPPYLKDWLQEMAQSSSPFIQSARSWIMNELLCFRCEEECGKWHLSIPERDSPVDVFSLSILL